MLAEETMFKPGDEVKLNSGGPAVTVERVRRDKVLTQWLTSGGRLQKGWFSNETVKPASRAAEAGK